VKRPSDLAPRSSLLPVAALLPVLLLAACSGSSQDQVGAGPTKAEYLAQAEAICTGANKDIAALPTPTSVAALQSLVEQSLRIAQDATGKIKQLEVPPADKAQLTTKVLDPLDGQLAEGKAFLEQVKAAIRKNDTAAIGRLIQNRPTGSKTDLAWMRSYGFKACVDAADTTR
jgi:hypothetical protein